MTPEEAMETGRARRAAPERSFTPPESAALMTLAGREAEASDPSRLIPAREERAHAIRLSCFMLSLIRLVNFAQRTYGQ